MAEVKVASDAKAALALAVTLLVVALVISDTAVTLLLAPFIFAGFVYTMSRVPMRHSMMTLMFLALTLENPSDRFGDGVWESPIHILGAFMLNHINTVDRSLSATSWMSFSGMDLSFAILLVVAFSRRQSGSKIDSAGRISAPKPLLKLAYVSLGGMFYVLLTGMFRQGVFGMALWQMDKVMYLPLVVLLFNMALRGPKDHPALARIVLGASVYRALLAFYIQQNFGIRTDPKTHLPMVDPYTGIIVKIDYATTHHDSMLYACGFVLALTLALEKADRATRWTAAVVLPILALGIVSNNRRMAWVQVGIVFLTIYLVSPDNRAKKLLRRGLMYTSPFIAVYLSAGWNSSAGVFAPVQTIRSVVDPKIDASTMWREMENYDLLYTIRSHPIMGVGYGNGYYEVITLPAVDYNLELFIPHNSILGLWAYGGWPGYTALTLIWAGGVYFGMRAYHGSKDGEGRAASMACVGAIVVYMIQCWGDMGLGSWIGVFLVAPAIAVAGKLAVATGQWGSKKNTSTGAKRRSRPPPGSFPDAEQAA